jgi:hypothetical protein
MCHLAD